MPNVLTHIAGSRCVVQHTHKDLYIDDKIDIRRPGVSCFEVVRNGQVIQSGYYLTSKAPEKMIALMKAYKL